MLKRISLIALSLLTVVGFSVAQQWNGLPFQGGPTYCASTVNSNCVSTIVAGPSDYSGNEKAPVDTRGASGTVPQTVYSRVTAFDQGALVKVASPATAAIADQTAFYVLSGTQGSAFTITMPPNPFGGDHLHIICDAATVGTMTVAANTGQTLRNNPAAACTAGVGYEWVYNKTAATWYRLQ